MRYDILDSAFWGKISKFLDSSVFSQLDSISKFWLRDLFAMTFTLHWNKFGRELIVLTIIKITVLTHFKAWEALWGNSSDRFELFHDPPSDDVNIFYCICFACFVASFMFINPFISKRGLFIKVDNIVAKMPTYMSLNTRHKWTCFHT